MVLKSFLSRELRCSGAAFPCRRGSTGAIFMQVFSTRRHASRIIFDVKGHLNGKVGGLEVTVYAVQRLVRCVQGQDTTIPANPVFTCCSHLTTWEGLSRGAVGNRTLCYFASEHLQRDVSCSFDLSQIQFLQLLVRHKENNIPRTKSQPIWPKPFI